MKAPSYGTTDLFNYSIQPDMGSDKCFLSLAWLGRKAQGIVDRFLVRLGSSGLANVQGSAILALETHGNTLLVFHLPAYALPTIVDSLHFEFTAYDMHQMIGQ